VNASDASTVGMALHGHSRTSRDSAVSVLCDVTVSSVHVVDPGLCLHRTARH